MTHVYKDLFGKDINEGDYIVYAAVDGRSGTLRTGKVLKLTETKTKDWRNEPPEPKVQVASWSNFRADRTWKDQSESSGRQKNVTLGFLDRLIVVSPDMVSEKIKKDLDGPICDFWGKPVETKEKK